MPEKVTFIRIRPYNYCFMVSTNYEIKSIFFVLSYMYSNHEFGSKLYVVGRPNPNHVNDFYIRILLELEVKSESKDFGHGRTVKKNRKLKSVN